MLIDGVGTPSCSMLWSIPRTITVTSAAAAAASAAAIPLVLVVLETSTPGSIVVGAG
jgi:hypothetical protein